jgi:hypothetical protein
VRNIFGLPGGTGVDWQHFDVNGGSIHFIVMNNLQLFRLTTRQTGWFLFVAVALLEMLPPVSAQTLDAGWQQPPPEARTRAYWWWLNGNVTSNAITRDLEEMKAKGWGGALLADAGGAEQGGNDRVPAGPVFASAEWRALFKHTLAEADRLGLELSLNAQSGWNIGGPMVKPEDAVKKLTWAETNLTGGSRVSLELPVPPANDNFYRDAFVLAWRNNPSVPANRPPLRNLAVKSMRAKLTVTGPDGWFIANSAPPTDPALFAEEPSAPGEADLRVGDTLDLSSKLSATGTLNWEAPPGQWQILRIGYTLADIRHVSTHSEGWRGYALDVLDQNAFFRYWDEVLEPLLADAKPYAGKTLKYLHTDSWEIGAFNWTPTFAREFRARRGYDLLPWLPVFAGRIVNSREECNRFLHDFRKTLGDLAADNHYHPFQQRAARHGLGIHPESGGPHFTPIDAQRLLGLNDVPMSEFWAESTTHRRSEITRFFVKQPASAAHTYGKRFVAAEGFTTVGPHWQETLWDNLLPSFNHALVEGLNRLVWHEFVCSPAEMGLPGQQYFAGTHINPNVTWWKKSGPVLAWLNRCQFMLQQGLPFADVLYYYGDHVPNYTQLRGSDPAGVSAGFDYDVITEEAILTRLSAKDGKLVLPDGVTYQLMVLPDREIISLPVLRKLRELSQAGGVILGPKPTQASGWANHAANDAEVEMIAAELWDSGRVITNQSAREVLSARGIPPDFEGTSDQPVGLEYIHRRAGAADIYFVANRAKTNAVTICAFRVRGKAPELWNPVTGERKFALAYTENDGRTIVPLDFAPCGAWFVIFRESAANHPARAASNAATFTPLAEISGTWTVRFDTNWAGPAEVQFVSLVSWTERPEPGIKFFSGTAVYEKTFELARSVISDRPSSVFLDLGNVRELAEVKVNGQTCGITWAPPFRVDITAAMRAGANKLQVEVVNFWPNRIIGDAALPREQRLTRTNIRKLTRDTKLMESGLLGPVKLLRATPPIAH